MEPDRGSNVRSTAAAQPCNGSGAGKVGEAQGAALAKRESESLLSCEERPAARGCLGRGEVLRIIKMRLPQAKLSSYWRVSEALMSPLEVVDGLDETQVIIVYQINMVARARFIPRDGVLWVGHSAEWSRAHR